MVLQEDQSHTPALDAGAVKQVSPNHLAKFVDPDFTLKGEARASVVFSGYKTIWFNTGTLCNITCVGCYIESSPRNDRLTYVTREEVKLFLDEASALKGPPPEIGFTGGEPFLNPQFMEILEDTLTAGFQVLILTNAMKPMQLKKAQLLRLQGQFPGRIHIRVSVDHFTQEGHEAVRGRGTWSPAIAGLIWLAGAGFDLAVAGRLMWHDSEAAIRSGYHEMFSSIGLPLDASSSAQLILFPEMSDTKDVPEITESCWGILGKSSADVMCSNSRMIVKRRGADRPVVVACTLLPYTPAFEMGGTLAEATGTVKLNHSHCARFCVLGGASCSVQK